jgi:hypothetical protein
VDAAAFEGLVKGRWQIGPPTRTFLLRPPEGKVITHQGRDLQTGEPVGISLLRPPWHQNRRVRQEHRHGHELLRGLDHPHVVKVHDIIDEPDLFAIVSEPLLGESLRRHIRYQADIPSEAQVVRLLLEIASGLEHAHGRGVVFGNVRPSSIEVLPGGTAKIMSHPKPPPKPFASFLDAADYLGYPVYAAPEVLHGQPFDERTDIYGLGICGYELIVSRLPHRPSENLGTEFWSLVSQEWPIPAEIVAEMHSLLHKVIVRCLHKEPAKRYPSVGELIADLRRVQGRSTPLVSSARLLEVVTSAFPAPLAVLAQALEGDDHLLAQKDKLLNLANGLVSYLGFLAAQGLRKPLGREYARPSLGHWVGLLRQALNGDEPVGWPLDELRTRPASRGDLLRTLDEVLRLRNRIAHAPTPEKGTLLHDWVKQMTACVRGLYRGLLLLAKYPVVVVEDLDFQEDRFLLTLRRMDGIGEHNSVLRVKSDAPYTKGRVYLAAADFSGLRSLHPWVAFARCPLCFRHELFFYTSAEDGHAHYVTPDRGHSWSCEPPLELARMWLASS